MDYSYKVGNYGTKSWSPSLSYLHQWKENDPQKSGVLSRLCSLSSTVLEARRLRLLVKRNWSRKRLILVRWWRSSDWSTASWRLFVGLSCTRRSDLQWFVRACQQFSDHCLLPVCRLYPPITDRKLGTIYSSSRCGMRLLNNKERDTCSTKRRLFPRCSGYAESLAVGRIAILISIPTFEKCCVCWSGVGESAPVGSICIENGGAGWERNRGLITNEETGWESAF